MIFFSYTIAYALLLSSDLFLSAEGTSLRGSDDFDSSVPIRRDLQANQVALYLIKETEIGATGSRQLGEFEQGNRYNRTDNIQLIDGTIYEVKNAQVGWASNLVSGDDIIRIPPGAIISSDGTIDMKGQKPTKGLFNRNLNEDSEESDDQSPLHSTSLQLQGGTRTVLAVRVILNDGSYSYASQTGLSNDIFGNGADQHNLKSQYAACSYNQLIFDKTPDRTMSTNPNDGTTNIASGVVDIKVDLNVADGDGTIKNAVSLKINSVFGVINPSQLASHVMYCLPPGVMNGIAYAYIDSWNSVYSNEWCNFLSSQMHEIGHNLGYGHSNEGGTSYADQTCMMGYSYGVDDSPVMCFNAAKSWQSKWYTSKSIVVDPSAGNCFEGKVYGIADYGTIAASTVLVKIDDASDTDFYVAFNRKSGINSGTAEAGDQVTVVRAGGEGNSFAASDLLAKLDVGGSWSGVVDGKTMVVNVLSINTSASPAYATVRISENGIACGPPLDLTTTTTSTTTQLPPTTTATTSTTTTTTTPPPPTTTTTSLITTTTTTRPPPTTTSSTTTTTTSRPPPTTTTTKTTTTTRPSCLPRGTKVSCPSTLRYAQCCSKLCSRRGSTKNTCL